MRCFVSLYAGLLWLCCSTAKGQQQNATAPSCHTTIAALVADIAAQNPFLPTDHILCPNTVFDIDDEDDTANEFYLRNNARILCGADGARSNNCTIRGGFNQIQCAKAFFRGEDKENVFISGITFSDALATAFLFSCPGSVLVSQCSFEDHSRGVGAIMLQHDSSRRRLIESSSRTRTKDVDRGQQNQAALLVPPSATDQQRNLQLDDSLSFDITFDDCIFEFNSHPEGPPFVVKQGVIIVESPSTNLVVKNSVFHDNYFGNKDIDPITYLVALEEEGSTVVLENNCFLLNDIHGLGIVNVYSPDQIISSDNNFGTIDPDTKCDFIHVETTGECVDYDLDTCPLGFSYEEPKAPVAVPTAESKATATTAAWGTLKIGSLLCLTTMMMTWWQ